MPRLLISAVVAVVLVTAATLSAAMLVDAQPLQQSEQPREPRLHAEQGRGQANLIAPTVGRIRYPPGSYPVLTLPNGERRTVRSLLDAARPMRFGDYLWDEAGVPPGPVWVRVDLGLQTLSVFRSGHEIGSTVILYGADRKPTPPGVYPVLERAERHRSTLYDAQMPYMLRLTPRRHRHPRQQGACLGRHARVHRRALRLRAAPVRASSAGRSSRHRGDRGEPAG